MDKEKVMSMLNYSVNNSFMINDTGSDSTSCWHYWIDWYYPYVIKESYPLYIQERTIDRGKKAYEIIKILRDKKLIEVRTVKQFVSLMDELIKIL